MITTGYDKYDDEPWEETVASIVFRYDNGNRIIIWKYTAWNSVTSTYGKFYALQEAYDRGFLTVDDIKSIAYYHETGKAISYVF
jgi:hypothetical protein